MDINEYTNIYNSLVLYNDKNKVHNNTVLDDLPINPVYPITIINEIRNTANQEFNSIYDRVSSLGYSIDIYAKSKGKISKKQIAREISFVIDKFMTDYVGLKRMGFIPENLVRDGSLHRITMTYVGNLHENRNKFI